jgi:hypothetical protein
MERCRATKANGEPCKGTANGSDGYCWAHSPNNASERRRLASRAGKRGGRGRPSVEVRQIKGRLKEIAEGILDGSIGHAKGAVASQVYNVYLRALKTELDIQERTELLERVEALEQFSEQRRRMYGP